jgi:hypothetical protein
MTESLRKFPSISYPAEVDGLENGIIFAQEKLDGANFRFARGEHVDGVTNGGLVFGSRNIVWKDETDVPASFTDHPDTGVGALSFVRERINIDELRALENNHGPLTLYGEAMHPHTLDYNWGKTPRVVLFDIWKHDEESYFHPKQVQSAGQMLNLPTVPHLGTFDTVQDIEIPESEYRDGRAEGVVLNTPTTGIKAKLVTDEFQEKHDRPNPDISLKTDTDLIVERIITDARIEKCAYKLVDSGKWDKLQMEMMEDLPERVIRDAMDEEAGSVVMENNLKIDTAELRSTASSRCARVLRAILQSSTRVDNND